MLKKYGEMLKNREIPKVLQKLTNCLEFSTFCVNFTYVRNIYICKEVNLYRFLFISFLSSLHFPFEERVKNEIKGKLKKE